MKLCKHKHKSSSEINIASMIDIIFLLIIFFMTVSQVTKTEAEPMDLPQAHHGKDQQADRPERIIVNIHKNGRIVIFSAEQTLAGAGDIFQQQVAQRKTLNQKAFVLLRCNRQTNWQNVSDVMALCREKGIHRVSVAVIENAE